MRNSVGVDSGGFSGGYKVTFFYGRRQVWLGSVFISSSVQVVLRRNCWLSLLSSSLPTGTLFVVLSFTMGYLDILKDKDDFKWDDQTRDQRDLVTQSIISIAFGLIAFLTFCVRIRTGSFVTSLTKLCPSF